MILFNFRPLLSELSNADMFHYLLKSASTTGRLFSTRIRRNAFSTTSRRFSIPVDEFSLAREPVFKYVFGSKENDKALIGFANAILDPSPEETIENVAFSNYLKYSGTVCDMACQLSNETWIISQLQADHPHQIVRNCFRNGCYAFVEQLDLHVIEMELRDYLPVHVINITRDFKAVPTKHNPDPISRHKFMDERTHANVMKDFIITFIDLKKFDNDIETLTTDQDRWLYFLKNELPLSLSKAREEMVTRNDVGLKTAYDAIRKYKNINSTEN